MKILFLDLDGVVNCHEPLDPEVMCGRLHPDKIQRVNHVLRETDAGLVLSSAWRYFVHRGEMSLAGLEWFLRSHGFLANRLIGVTRPDTVKQVNPLDGGLPIVWCQQDERGAEIAEYMSDFRSHPVLGGKRDAYAVVDDLDLGISAAGHPFVQTDGKVGLTDADAAKLIELLGGERKEAK